MFKRAVAQALLPVFAFLGFLSLAVSQDAPEQPVPFSHKWHAGNLKLDCKKCHVNPDPGETMGIAKPAICLECHATVKTESPHIQKLAAAAKENRELNWARIYSIPGYVNFSHRPHMEKGNKCEECHGQVATRERLYREGNISMGGCMDCHREKKASIDCSFCHEPK